MSQSVKLLVGPPGTGKTTSLLSIVDQALERGVHPTRIAALTFTRKAAEELVARACVKFPKYAKSDFPLIRTMHSLAFQRNKLSHSRVMDKDAMDRFCKEVVGFPYNRQFDAMGERSVPGGALGDVCGALYTKARVSRLPYMDVWRTDGDRVDSFDFEHFCREMDKYKARHNIVDYCDFLEGTMAPLDVDLFLVDEAQDLSRQQWEVARAWGSNAAEVIYAGDDDQAIFQWAGACVDEFLGLARYQETLPVSYRLPRSVFRTCRAVAGRISRRLPKTWSPRDEEGEVLWRWSYDDVDLHAPGSWLLLCRNRYQFKGFEEALRLRGLPYVDGNGRSSMQTDEMRAVVAYQRMKLGGHVPRSEAEKAVKFVAGASLPKDGPPDVLWNDARWPFKEQRPNWMGAMDLMRQPEVSYIRRVLAGGWKPGHEVRHRISTMHSIKGGEADNVLLPTETSESAWRTMAKEPDEELRVWYVGCSRARKRLVVIPSTKFSVHNFLA